MANDRAAVRAGRHARLQPPATVDASMDLLNQILAEYTGQGVERIARDVDRDYIMSAEQAVEYGMIDRVVSSRELAPQPVARRSPDSRFPEDGAG